MMSQEIVRVTSPEEQELQKYLSEIERLKHDVATKLADLESYKAELARFSAEYHAVLGPLFAELDRLELEIAEYQRKIDLLQSRPDMTHEEIDEVIEKEFREQHERIHHDEEENQAYERAWTQEQQRPELNESDAEEFKRVYRDLAKKHHPDFAVDEADRIERENAMKMVNEAFAARDLSSLKNLRDYLIDHLVAFERMSIGERLIWAIREIARLSQVCSDISLASKELQGSTMYLVYSKFEDYRVAIEEVRLDLTSRIQSHEMELKHLVHSYRSAIEGQ